MLFVFLTLLRIVLLPAMGQDLPLEEAQPVEEDAKPLLPFLPNERERLEGIFREKWQLRTLFPSRYGKIASISPVAENPRRIAVIGEDGRVWVSEDAGGSWKLVKDALSVLEGDSSTDEDDLLGIQSRIDELMDERLTSDQDELEEEFEGYTEEQLADEAARDFDDALKEAVSQVQADMETDQRFILGDKPGLLVEKRLWSFKGGHLFAGRADGLWYSEDWGTTWTQAMKVSPLALGRLPGGIWVAGTTDGARLALDPRAWIDVDDQTEGVLFRHLQVFADGILAGGPEGLFYSEDGQNWRRRDSVLGRVLAMATSPQFPQEVWIVTDQGLISTTDGGQTIQPSIPLPVPLEKPSSIALLDRGRFVISGADGVVETTDSGVTWRMMNRGLHRQKPGRFFRWGPEGVNFLSGGDVFRLVPASVSEGAMEESTSWVPLGALMKSAIEREGLKQGKSIRTARRRAALLPNFRIEGRFRDAVVLRWDRYSGSSFDTRGEWAAFAMFHWKPRRRSGSDVGVIGGGQQPLVVSSNFDGAVAIRVNRTLAQYQRELSDRVRTLYKARHEMIMEREEMGEASLLERVFRELLIRHVEADLDWLSDGMVSRWNPDETP